MRRLRPSDNAAKACAKANGVQQNEGTTTRPHRPNKRTAMATRTELNERYQRVTAPIKPLTESVIEYSRNRRDGERDAAGRIISAAEKDERALTATEQQQVDRAM